MQLLKSDLQPIIDHLNRKGLVYGNKESYLTVQLRAAIDKSTTDSINIKDINWIYSKNCLQDGHLQNLIYLLGEKYGTPYPKFIESELLKNSWGGEKIVSYTKFIKNKEYYPEDDNVIFEIIKGNSYDNNRIFKSLLTLSTLIKDNKNSCDSFSATLQKRTNYKYNPIPLLELEKIENLFNKRFKNIDKDSLPKESYAVIKEIFDKIEATSKIDILTEESGYFFKIKIDLDALSQKNKLTIGKVTDGVRKFVWHFTCFIEEDNEVTKNYSLTDFKCEGLEGAKFAELTIFFQNPEKRELIQNTIKKLLEVGLSKGQARDITFIDIFAKYEDSNEYFQAYFNKESLEQELNKKGDISKKLKI